VEGIPEPLTLRRFVAGSLPVLAGTAFLIAVILVGSSERTIDSGIWSRPWRDDSPPRQWVTFAAVVFSGVLILILLRALFQWLMEGRDTRAARLMHATPLPAARAASRSAIEQVYGFDLVVAWPRLQPLIGDRLGALIRGRREVYEFAVRCASTAAAVALAAVVLLPVWPRTALLLPIPVVLAWIGYRTAVRSATGYGQALRVAFDLHRFDLLAALHLPLPEDLAAEQSANRKLSESWSSGTGTPTSAPTCWTGSRTR